MFRIGAGSTLFAVMQVLLLQLVVSILVLQQHNRNGNATFTGIVTASSFVGNGQGLTNINVSETGWSQVDETYAGAGNTGIYAFGSGDVDIARVGIGTSVPHFALDLGDDSKVGTGLTNLVVQKRI